MTMTKMFDKTPAKPEPKVLDISVPESALPIAALSQDNISAEFDTWLAQRYTVKNDFKMKGSRLKDTVLYVLISLGLEPTMGNYRKYDPILDWEAICMDDLRRKGIVE